jgi:hypothetical protein
VVQKKLVRALKNFAYAKQVWEGVIVKCADDAEAPSPPKSGDGDCRAWHLEENDLATSGLSECFPSLPLWVEHLTVKRSAAFFVPSLESSSRMPPGRPAMPVAPPSLLQPSCRVRVVKSRVHLELGRMCFAVLNALGGPSLVVVASHSGMKGSSRCETLMPSPPSPDDDDGWLERRRHRHPYAAVPLRESAGVLHGTMTVHCDYFNPNNAQTEPLLDPVEMCLAVSSQRDKSRLAEPWWCHFLHVERGFDARVDVPTAINVNASPGILDALSGIAPRLSGVTSSSQTHDSRSDDDEDNDSLHSQQHQRHHQFEPEPTVAAAHPEPGCGIEVRNNSGLSAEFWPQSNEKSSMHILSHQVMKSLGRGGAGQNDGRILKVADAGASGAVGGVIIGAIIGSILFPGVGTSIGAVVGGAVGATGNVQSSGRRHFGKKNQAISRAIQQYHEDDIQGIGPEVLRGRPRSDTATHEATQSKRQLPSGDTHFVQLPNNCLELVTQFEHHVDKIDLKVGSGNIGVKQIFQIRHEESTQASPSLSTVVCETVLQENPGAPKTCVLTFRGPLRVRSRLNIPIQVVIRRDGHSSSLTCYDKSYEIGPCAFWDVPITFLELDDCSLTVFIREGNHIEERGPFPIGCLLSVDGEFRKDIKARNLEKQLLEKGAIKLTKREVSCTQFHKAVAAAEGSHGRGKGGGVEIDGGEDEDESAGSGSSSGSAAVATTSRGKVFEYCLEVLPMLRLTNALPIPITFEILQQHTDDTGDDPPRGGRRSESGSSGGGGATDNNSNATNSAWRQSKSVLPGEEAHVIGLDLGLPCSIVFVLETLPGHDNLVSEPTVFPLERHKNWVKDFDKNNKTVTFNGWNPLYERRKKSKSGAKFDGGVNADTPMLHGSIQCRRHFLECAFHVCVFSPVWVINKSGLSHLYKYHAPLLTTALKTNKHSQSRRENRQQRFYGHHSEAFQSPKHDDTEPPREPGSEGEGGSERDKSKEHSRFHFSQDILPMKTFDSFSSATSSLASSVLSFDTKNKRSGNDESPKSSEDIIFAQDLWCKIFGANAPILLPSQDGKLQVGVHNTGGEYPRPSQEDVLLSTPRRGSSVGFGLHSRQRARGGSGGGGSNAAPTHQQHHQSQQPNTTTGSQKVASFMRAVADEDGLKTQLDAFQFYSKVSAGCSEHLNFEDTDSSSSFSIMSAAMSGGQKAGVSSPRGKDAVSWSKEYSLDDKGAPNEYKDFVCGDAFVASASLADLPGVFGGNGLSVAFSTFPKFVIKNDVALSPDCGAVGMSDTFSTSFSRGVMRSENEEAYLEVFPVLLSPAHISQSSPSHRMHDMDSGGPDDQRRKERPLPHFRQHLPVEPEQGSTVCLKQGQALVVDKFTMVGKRSSDSKRAVYIRWAKRVYRSQSRSPSFQPHASFAPLSPKGRSGSESGSGPGRLVEEEEDGPMRMLYTPWSSPLFLDKECRQYCSFPSIFVDHAPSPSPSFSSGRGSGRSSKLTATPPLHHELTFASALLQYTVENLGAFNHVSVRDPFCGTMPCRIDNHLARQTVVFQYVQGGMEASNTGACAIAPMAWNAVLFDESEPQWTVEVWLKGYERKRILCHFDAEHHAKSKDGTTRAGVGVVWQDILHIEQGPYIQMKLTVETTESIQLVLSIVEIEDHAVKAHYGGRFIVSLPDDIKAPPSSSLRRRHAPLIAQLRVQITAFHLSVFSMDPLEEVVHLTVQVLEISVLTEYCVLKYPYWLHVLY